MIYDEFRKGYFVATPEEWVRQNFAMFLVHHKGFPAGRIAVEKQVKVLNINKRFDILVYDSKMSPQLLVECKSPRIKIDQSVFSQVGIYNMELKAEYLIATNGLSHFAARIDFAEKKYSFLDHIPDFKDIISI